MRYKSRRQRFEDAQERVVNVMAEMDEEKNSGGRYFKAKVFRWLEELREVKMEVESLYEELDNWYNNMPDNLQGSMKAMMIEEAMGGLDEVNGHLDEAIERMEALMNGKDEISEDEMEEIISELEEIDGIGIEFPGMY